MKNTLIAILVIGIIVVGYLFIREKTKPTDYSNVWPETVPAAPHTGTTTNINPNGPDYTPPQNNSGTSTSTQYKNDQLGFSLNYPESFGQVSLQISPGDTGKMIVGRICPNEEKPQMCMFIGGTTSVITFPGELNANEVSSYPTSTELKKLSDRGYRNETKINSKGEEYVLIYGQKEVDMPYIGEGQMVAIFKLKSSVDFKALGFMLVRGDAAAFLSIMDSVDIY